MPKTRLLLVFALLGIVTFSLTFLVLFLTDEPEIPDIYSKESQLAQLNSGPEPLSVNDFLVPDLDLYHNQPQYYLFRKRLSAWDTAQVQQYWLAPKTIIIDLLSRKSDKQMEEFLKKIP